MIRRLRIAVVGYGIAGISAAIFLRQLGHEIVHYERSVATGPAGGGLLLNGVGLAVLDRLGLRAKAIACGAIITRVRGETLDGRQVMDLRYEEHGSDEHGLGIERSTLWALLSAADERVALHTSTSIVSVDAANGFLFSDDGVRLGPFDLIVAADGAGSGVRAALSSLVRHDRGYPWGALVCLLDDPIGIGANCVFQSFAGTRHASIWPVGSRTPDTPGRVSVSVNVPMKQLESLRGIEAWRAYSARLCPRLHPLLGQTIGEPLLFWYRDTVLRRFYRDRIVLIGDAAHSMSPQLGQGANAGMLDAWALARAMERNADTAMALADYDQERRAAVCRVQRLSRWVTPIFQSDSRVLAALRDHALPRLSRLPFIKASMLRTLCGHCPIEETLARPRSSSRTTVLPIATASPGQSSTRSVETNTERALFSSPRDTR